MNRLLTFVLTCGFILCSLIAFSQTEPVGPEINYYFSKLQERNQFNGVVLVGEKGRILYSKAFGYSDPETKKPLSTEAVFELASITKTFTAAGIFSLKDESKLRLDDDVRKYLPKIPYEGITVRHLLSHTSGLPDYVPLLQSYSDKNKFATNETIIEILCRHKPTLHFAPGTKWEYSNTGYVLLASIIANVSKTEYASFLQQHIFEPLKLKHTFVRSRPDQNIPHLVAGYIRPSFLADNRVLPQTLPRVRFGLSLTGIVGDRGVCSTAEDLLRWARTLDTEKLMKRSTFRDAITPVKLMNGTLATPVSNSNESHYGMGWFLRNGEKGTTELWHTGSYPGYASYLVRNLQLDQTIVVLANTGDSAVTSGVNAIQNMISARTYSFPKLSIGRAIGKIVLQKGVSAAIQEYRKLKKDADGDYNFSEPELNNLGYALLQQNKVSDAIAIFQLNVEVFPNSWNVYDSLGEAYAKNGNRTLAIQHYEKSIKINPQNLNGIAILKKLKEHS